MGDQRPWIKLWKSFRRDPDLQRLSLERQARWVHLLLFVAENGTDGTWSGPLRQLVTALRVVTRGSRSRDIVVTLIGVFPGVTYTCSDGPDQRYVTVTFTNWRKYQDSGSTDRMRRLRSRRNSDGPSDGPQASHGRVTVTPQVTRNVTEVEVDKNPPTPLTSSHGSNGQPRFTWPPNVDHAQTNWTPNDRRPYEALNHTCPDRAWRGTLCVARAYYDTHPEARASLPCAGHMPDGAPIPKQCPVHRAEVTPAW